MNKTSHQIFFLGIIVQLLEPKVALDFLTLDITLLMSSYKDCKESVK